jgi:hypothetical protein
MISNKESNQFVFKVMDRQQISYICKVYFPKLYHEFLHETEMNRKLIESPQLIKAVDAVPFSYLKGPLVYEDIVTVDYCYIIVPYLENGSLMNLVNNLRAAG